MLHCINSRRIYTLLDIALHKSILLTLAHSCPHKIRIIAVFILLWKLTSYRINNKRSPGKQRIYLLGHISGDKISTAKNLIFVMFANSSLRTNDPPLTLACCNYSRGFLFLTAKRSWGCIVWHVCVGQCFYFNALVFSHGGMQIL